MWCRRQPALAATILTAILGIALVAAVSFSQVVHERDRFHQERDRAEANLYRALAGETRALMKARDTGWWWKAMTNIEAAARLDTARPGRSRELAVEAMNPIFMALKAGGADWSDSFRSPVQRCHFGGRYGRIFNMCMVAK